MMWEGAQELFVLLTRQLHASLLLTGAHIRFKLVSFAYVNVLILAMPYRNTDLKCHLVVLICGE